MTYIGISKLSYFVSNVDADTYHYYCYHGFELRGRVFASFASHARINQPEISLWVNKDAMHALKATMPGDAARFTEVEYFPFDVPFNLGSFAHWDDPRFANDDGESLMEALAALSLAKPYKKMIWHLPEMEQADESSRDAIELRMGPTQWDTPLRIKARPSVDLLAFSVGDAHFFHPSVFEVIKPFILEKLYTIRIFDL